MRGAHWRNANVNNGKKVKSKDEKKKVATGSLLSVEASSSAPVKKVVEVKGNWVNVRATMETGVAGHVMPAGMCPHLKLTCSSMEKKFVAANEEKISDLGEKILSFKTTERTRRCIKFRNANIVKPLISMRRLCRLAMSWCWMKRTRTFGTSETAKSSKWT